MFGGLLFVLCVGLLRATLHRPCRAILGRRAWYRVQRENLRKAAVRETKELRAAGRLVTPLEVMSKMLAHDPDAEVYLDDPVAARQLIATAGCGSAGCWRSTCPACTRARNALGGG